MSYYIDEKVTIWRRTYYNVEGTEEEIKNKLIDQFESKYPTDIEIFDSEILYETEESITPEENNGMPTIEIFNDNGDTIWSNVKEKN